MAEHTGKPLPQHLRLLLKCTLPAPEDIGDGDTDSRSTHDEDGADKVTRHLVIVDDRLAVLEGKFDFVQEKLEGLEAKLDTLLAALAARTEATS